MKVFFLSKSFIVTFVFVFAFFAFMLTNSVNVLNCIALLFFSIILASTVRFISLIVRGDNV